MERSIDSIFKKYAANSNSEETGIEILDVEMTSKVRGGDREYIPIYETANSDMEWGKISQLIDSLK